METTAHPDDEDNALLAMMSHGRGMRTTLVSATRGDGGQNEIGPEIFQALGVLRTEELLAVHRFDGAEQYFTRAVDFGFSFSIEESIEKWGHDEIVGDYVRHIRTIRPDVIVGFLCGGGGGGQHHQASTRLTLEAFRAAADPSRYPGTDPRRTSAVAGQARVLHGRTAGAGWTATPDLLRDGDERVRSAAGPDVCRARTRSPQHAQMSGHVAAADAARRSSPSRTYRLKDSVIGEAGVAPKDLFDGIDTSLTGLAKYAGATAASESRECASNDCTQRRCRRNRRLRRAVLPAAAAPLVQGLAALSSLRASLPRSASSPRHSAGCAIRNRFSACAEGIAVRGSAAADARHPSRGACR